MSHPPTYQTTRQKEKKSLVSHPLIRQPHPLPCRPQEPTSLGLATFSAEPSSGGIAAKGEQLVEVTLSTVTLGRVQIPVRVRTPGSRGKPLEFVIDARSVGPSLELGAEPGKR